VTARLSAGLLPGEAETSTRASTRRLTEKVGNLVPHAKDFRVIFLLVLLGGLIAAVIAITRL
jgi:hypothetical protein